MLAAPPATVHAIKRYDLHGDTLCLVPTPTPRKRGRPARGKRIDTVFLEALADDAERQAALHAGQGEKAQKAWWTAYWAERGWKSWKRQQAKLNPPASTTGEPAPPSAGDHPAP